jgi:hypothetical protein
MPGGRLWRGRFPMPRRAMRKRAWLSNYLCGKPTEQGKTLRAHLVEELAGVDMAAYDAFHMRRLFGGE